MKFFTRRRITTVALATGTIILSFGLVSIPTDKLIGIIGTENSYLFMFVLAFVGSLSTFASIPYPLILIGLVSGGVDPVIAGLSSASGVILADSFTFIASRRGRGYLPSGMQHSFQKLSLRIERYPRLLTPGLFLYGTLSPLSNDFAVISLSFMKYSFWRIILPLGLGNIVYNVTIAFLGIYAYNWVTQLLQ